MAEQQQAINLSNLTLEQLNQVKQQIEEEAQHLTNSAQQLKLAGAKYSESKEAVQGLSGTKGKTLLVPLTGSLYVSGVVAEDEKVMVDIGTGYYVEKSLKDAQEYADRKIKIISDQVLKVQQAINIKRNNLDAVVGVMQQKITAYQQQQKQADPQAV